MALYLISYDITVKDKFEYEPLYAKLKGLDAIRILYSQWVMPSDPDKATHIYNVFKGLIQDKDRLLVQEVTKDASWDKLIIGDEDFRKILRAHARG